MKTVFFDWGGVIIDDPGKDLFEAVSKIMGVSVDEFSKVHLKYERDWQTGKLKEQDMWVKELKEHGLSNVEINWEKIFSNVMVERPEMFAIANHLKRNGFKIAILSNTEEPATKNMDSKYEIFDEKMLSWEVGEVKPDKEIYEIALKKLNCKAEEAIFIDDRKENIKAANELGIKGFLFEDMEKTKKFIYDLVY